MNHTILLVDSLLVGTGADCDVNVHVLAQWQIPSHMHSFQGELEAANDTTGIFFFSLRQDKQVIINLGNKLKK